MTPHTQSAVFLGGKMLLSLRYQLHCILNLKPHVYSLLALPMNGWKYFSSAFCTHKDFGTKQPLLASVLKKDRLYHSVKIYMMAERCWHQKFPSQKNPTTMSP